MWRWPVMILAVAGVALSAASAQTVKNARMTYGAVGAARYGATRADDKYLPGEIMLLAFDIDGLKVNSKLGTASWEGEWEVLDANRKPLAKGAQKIPAQDVLLQLGGTTVPADVFVEMPAKGTAGTYFLKLTVTDRLAKVSKPYEHEFKLAKADDFGIVGLTAPAFGICGTQLPITFAVVNTPLRDKDGDKKKGELKGLPRVDLTMRVFEAGGKTEVGLPMRINWPQELPERTQKKGDRIYIPAQFSVYLNRPGRFRAEVEVQDHIKGQKLKVDVPFTVLDLK
jgi:hypothetical protein